MSYIEFESINRLVNVAGSERGHFGTYANKVVWSVLCDATDPIRQDGNPLKSVIPSSNHVHQIAADRPQEIQKALRLFVECGRSTDVYNIQGQPTVFSVAVNTAYRLGCDFVKMAMRIHAQCECSAWIKAENYAWVARIIDEGLRVGFYRRHQGWSKLAAWLRECTDPHIVLNHTSGCGFMSEFAHDFDGDEDDREKLWNYAITQLIESGGGREIKPQGWNDFYFTNGATAFHVLQATMVNKTEKDATYAK